MSKNKDQKKSSASRPLSLKKRMLFYGITISIPVLFFIFLEVGLRASNYMGNTDLFVDPQIELDDYLIPNPNFASRYFFYTRTIPNPSNDVFLREKPENGFRVFAMGGSSAAGYPYGFNATYSRVVRDVLTDAMPDKQVEVVNVGISAISSYTLFDQVDEIIAQKPDAIILYAGHNEFYGALGVGSNENLGGFPGFVRLYLKLQRFKTFLLLRNMMVESGKLIGGFFSSEEIDESATLMERIINTRSIELDSPTYELAMHQFRSNLEEIVKKFDEYDIPVFVGSLGSNLKDQPPFINITDGDQPPAQDIYGEAVQLYNGGNIEQAAEKFEYAKDLDGLKFRAPSQINTIIEQTAESFSNVRYVPSNEALIAEAKDGIIGHELMLEHLHPNERGYFILGEAFANALIRDFTPDFVPDSNIDYQKRMYLSEFDRRMAWHRVATLKQSFPFVMGEKPRSYTIGYDPISAADSLAFLSVHKNLRWDLAKVELAKIYESRKQFDKAILEYRGLSRNQPWNDSPYVFAARIYLDQGKLKEAEPLLEKAISIYKKDAFTTKMLGAIKVSKGDNERGIELLENSLQIKPNDPQTLYNLSGAYFNLKQYDKALEAVEKGLKINPNFPGLQQWRNQLKSVMNQ
ncbi:MAG TPA: hypothetical protein DEQ34_06305 [Balneolaceae bacterium]|nr:hypothetical protein [Balneolaceae bacterium]|tara:strand:+ start:92776 stop:94674 length:1899 start_codon:yes stop_codon:yes gene_type:complete